MDCSPPSSTEFSRQEYKSGLPFPTPGDLPDPRIEPVSLAYPALVGSFLTNKNYQWSLLNPHFTKPLSCKSGVTILGWSPESFTSVKFEHW